MAQLLSTNDVRKQSLGVWGQFGHQIWIPNAKKNAALPRKNAKDLEHVGVGRFAVLCAMGSSLEAQIETIKKYRDRVDVICCDKAFGPLIEHGVKADYVIVADASIPFSYLQPWVEHTRGVKLLATPYANPEWTQAWLGDRYFYVNQDAIETERVFLPLMGRDTRMIPAGSNVSNAMLVLWTDCGGRKNANWGGYERYYLVGYDYSWPIKGNYYAWSNPIPKRFYMNHQTRMDFNGNDCFTSENLFFSAKWLFSYITTFDLPVMNCSNRGLLDIPSKGILERELARITPNARARSAVRTAYESWKQSHAATARAEMAFNESREAMLWQ